MDYSFKRFVKFYLRMNLHVYHLKHTVIQSIFKNYGNKFGLLLISLLNNFYIDSMSYKTVAVWIKNTGQVIFLIFKPLRTVF